MTKAKGTPKGRASIFRDKAGGDRLQGIITRVGSKRFEEARELLRCVVLEQTGETPATVSDADTIEFLARGEANTRAYLRGQVP